MTPTTEFVAKMAELSAAFKRRTADDGAEFERLGIALSKGDDAAHRDRIQYLAHRLAGGSSTFGLMMLEEPASDLETRILAEASAEEVSALSQKLSDVIRTVCGVSPATTEPQS